MFVVPCRRSVRYCSLWADPGFFLGGSTPLRNDVTERKGKPISKANTKKASSQGPSPKICPWDLVHIRGPRTKAQLFLVTPSFFTLRINLQYSLHYFSSCGSSSRVDILICTPGRLVDHISSTPNFTLHHVRFLVIDEADRLLDQSYHGWLSKVLKAAYHRQDASGVVKNDRFGVHHKLRNQYVKSHRPFVMCFVTVFCDHLHACSTGKDCW